MESPKMHSFTRCKNRIYLCGTANYPVSCKPVQGQERKFAEIRVHLSPLYRVCTKAMFISKASCRNGESKKFIALVGAKTALTCEGRQTAPSHASQYRAKNVNLRNLGLSFSMVPCQHKSNVYIKRKLQVKSQKMNSSSRCKTRTYLCGTVNCPVSCNPVQDREHNVSEIWVYLSPRYRVCNKAMFKSKGSYKYGGSKNTFLQSVQKPHLPVRDGKLPRLM